MTELKVFKSSAIPLFLQYLCVCLFLQSTIPYTGCPFGYLTATFAFADHRERFLLIQANSRRWQNAVLTIGGGTIGEDPIHPSRPQSVKNEVKQVDKCWHLLAKECRPLCSRTRGFPQWLSQSWMTQFWIH